MRHTRRESQLTSFAFRQLHFREDVSLGAGNNAILYQNMKRRMRTGCRKERVCLSEEEGSGKKKRSAIGYHHSSSALKKKVWKFGASKLHISQCSGGIRINFELNQESSTVHRNLDARALQPFASFRKTATAAVIELAPLGTAAQRPSHRLSHLGRLTPPIGNAEPTVLRIEARKTLHGRNS